MRDSLALAAKFLKGLLFVCFQVIQADMRLILKGKHACLEVSARGKLRAT